ncbi:hypothetical protein ACFQ0K_17825 [Nocardioides caeni]|uniref:Uncharacterized protein n=1 Tax=Nocardioides caeni TaxID=574700 RepID=A0A4S8NET8_9ACTN|nr:hypothetical protein [Nocardioides caeni]THV13374.1 hypothetical protein E9934_10455 [Nocardioides caeni]
MTGLMDHLRSQVRSVLDPSASASVRASHAHTAAETASDIRDAIRAGELVLRGARVMQMLDGGEGARDPLHALAEYRDLADFPGLLPTHVLNDGLTGYGPVPLVRGFARPWQTGDLKGTTPILPGFTTAGPFAGIDPTLPLTPDTDGWAIVDVAAGEARHWSILGFDVSRQLADWIGPTGNALLDQLVLDDVDLAAETFVAAAMVTAAGGTRAAGADLGAALDEAEGAAGVRGPVQALVVNAVDWPAVRRAVASTFFDGPHPQVLVSAGQAAGTATYVGYGAVRFIVDGYERQEVEAPRSFGKTAAVARPFYFEVRDAAGLQTVTGIGA